MHHVDVMIEAHKAREAAADATIEQVHLAAAIELRVRRTQSGLSRD